MASLGKAQQKCPNEFKEAFEKSLNELKRDQKLFKIPNVKKIAGLVAAKVDEMMNHGDGTVLMNKVNAMLTKVDKGVKAANKQNQAIFKLELMRFS